MHSVLVQLMLRYVNKIVYYFQIITSILQVSYEYLKIISVFKFIRSPDRETL